MRRVVSNTGPLLHLSEAQALDLLRLAGEVHTPGGVEAEMLYLDPQWREPVWMSVDQMFRKP